MHLYTPPTLQQPSTTSQLSNSQIFLTTPILSEPIDSIMSSMSLSPALGFNNPFVIDAQEALFATAISNKKALTPYRPSRFELLPKEIRDMIYEELGYPIAGRKWFIDDTHNRNRCTCARKLRDCQCPEPELFELGVYKRMTNFEIHAERGGHVDLWFGGVSYILFTWYRININLDRMCTIVMLIWTYSKSTIPSEANAYDIYSATKPSQFLPS